MTWIDLKDLPVLKTEKCGDDSVVDCNTKWKIKNIVGRFMVDDGVHVTCGRFIIKIYLCYE